MSQLLKLAQQERWARNLEWRFWSKVQQSDGCWTWTGTRTLAGYGQLKVNGKPTYAHRFSLILAGISVPADAVVRHSCDTPSCVNPRHLIVGTQQENMADAQLKGRLVGGPRKERCLRGHDFTDENSYWAGGRRQCRACKAERGRAYNRGESGRYKPRAEDAARWAKIAEKRDEEEAKERK